MTKTLIDLNKTKELRKKKISKVLHLEVYHTRAKDEKINIKKESNFVEKKKHERGRYFRKI